MWPTDQIEGNSTYDGNSCFAWLYLAAKAVDQNASSAACFALPAIVGCSNPDDWVTDMPNMHKCMDKNTKHHAAYLKMYP